VHVRAHGRSLIAARGPRYIGYDRWYVQEQMEILYLPLEWNYCTAATYIQLAADTGASLVTARACERGAECCIKVCQAVQAYML
jgi:hypothetical protein